MSEMSVEGLENVPGQPMLFLPNRVDLAVMEALENALTRASGGGAGRVGWLIEVNHAPSPDIMQRLQTQRSAGMMVDLERESHERLGQRVRDFLSKGRHLVVLPPATEAAPGSLSDCSAKLLSLTEGLNLPLLPVSVSFLRRQGPELLATAAPYDRAVVRVMPQVHGAAPGSRVLMAWMDASADALAKLPLIEDAALAQALMDSMLAHPDARLIDGVDDSFTTYRDLLAQALIFADLLRARVNHPRLGIILPPGKYSVIAHLACWFCGIVPVDVDYTAEEKDFRRFAGIAGINRYITEERFVQLANRFAWPPQRDRILIDRELAEAGSGRLRFRRLLLRFRPSMAHRDRLPQPDAQAEAALCSTGGVCGEPKMVPLTRRMLLGNALQCLNRLQLSPGETVLSVLPFYTPFGMTLGLILPLLRGMDMVTYSMLTAEKRLCSLMSRYAVRLAALTPEVLRAVLKVAKEDTFSSLRYMLSVGDALPSDVRRVAETKFHLPLLDAYGLSETGPMVALNLPPAAEPGKGARANKPRSVGAPLPGVAVRISDPYRGDVLQAAGVPGMIWVKGPGVLPHYLNDEPADLERIRGSWFCTGDIGHLDADGLLTIDGRKIRFSKIDREMVPHEILEEELIRVLRADPAAPRRQIAVVGVPDRTKGERLVMLSTLHRISHPNDLLTIRYGLMNNNRPAEWSPTLIAPVKHIPVLPSGRLNYPKCYEIACKAAGVNV